MDSQRGSTIFHLAQYSRCTRGESPNRKKKTKSYDSQRNTPAGVVTCSSTAFRWGNHICRVESPAATKSTCWDCFAIVLPYFLLLLISVNRCNLCKSRRKGKRNPFITCYYFSFTLYFYYFPISEWRSIRYRDVIPLVYRNSKTSTLEVGHRGTDVDVPEERRRDAGVL